ncbi:MAG: thioredoxin family protein [Candidatus Cloacimonetes bacterium]|nr:thioredoxin family protein [Candidatus Cloacimonadota bacterium]
MRHSLTILMVSMALLWACNPAAKDKVSVSEQKVNEVQSSQDYEPGTWIEDWDQAIATAKTQNRTVLVNFTGSDWCGWCKRLSSEVFTQEAFTKYARENLILLKLDFPHQIEQSVALKQQNDKLMRQFGVQGYPTILLVDEEGKEIGRTGYQPGGVEAYIEHLKELQIH